jgi:hypothetical protein
MIWSRCNFSVILRVNSSLLNSCTETWMTLKEEKKQMSNVLLDLKAELWIRIQHFQVNPNPDKDKDTDTDTDPDPIRIQGFDF